MSARYDIAGLIVQMESYGRTFERARRYSCKKNQYKADIVMNRTDIDRLKSNFNFKDPGMSDDLLEYNCTGALFYSELTNFNGIFFHASAVVVDGSAYLFSADSGTGKSTHTSIWLKLFGDRAYILNDDKPALRYEDGAWYAYGTPWSGKHDISVNARVPLAGIAVLERGDANEIYQCDPTEVIDTLVKQIMSTNRPERMIKILENLDMLLGMIPVYRLKCNMDPEAAIVSYEAMSGEKFVPTTEM